MSFSVLNVFSVASCPSRRPGLLSGQSLPPWIQLSFTTCWGSTARLKPVLLDGRHQRMMQRTLSGQVSDMDLWDLDLDFSLFLSHFVESDESVMKIIFFCRWRLILRTNKCWYDYDLKPFCSCMCRVSFLVFIISKASSEPSCPQDESVYCKLQ